MITIAVQQPSLAKYRIPLYRQWSLRLGINLCLYYSNNDQTLPNEDPVGFDAEYVPTRIFSLGKHGLMWHSAQWDNATRKKCDVLVLSWDVHYLSIIPALVRARLNGVKTILWGHGYSKKESLIKKIIRDSVGRMADAIVLYDHVTAKKYIDSGWPLSKIHVAPNSMDQETVQSARSIWINDEMRLKKFQSENGLAGKNNIIYIGRIYSENRLDLLIVALPKILEQHPDTQLLFIGKVNKCAQKLQQLADSLGVSGAIKWLGPIYEEEKISPYMLSSSLFCYPANVGLSLMHAMGYGVPVITGNLLKCHNPEIHVLKDKKNGLLFENLNPNDLAEKVTIALEHPEELVRLGNNARETVLNGFTTKDMVDGFMAAVKAVCDDD